MPCRFASCLTLLPLLLSTGVTSASAQKPPIVWTAGEKPVYDKIKTLRDVPDDQRGAVTRQLARQIRQLPASKNQLTLANGLAGLSTEGDFGHDTLQEVATVLSDVLREQAAASKEGMPEDPYVELAQLVRYEHVTVPLDSPLLNAALARLQAEDQQRAKADFTLTDLKGQPWTLHQLRGKVVVVNFWATWCSPCRKEMPDLDALYQRFRDQGLVVLAISDEDDAKVRPFIMEKKFSYPVLLDPDRKINKLFAVEGIPKSFVFDRAGKLVSQAIDMRTKAQFLAMLAQAGLK